MATTLRGSDAFDTAQASQAEMELGTETASRAMSPEGVAQAVAALETPTAAGLLTLDNMMQVQDVQATGVAAGTNLVTNDAIRVLNTVVHNTITGASLASNLVTLPAGTYWVEGLSLAFRTGSYQTFVINNGNSAVLIEGYSQYVDSAVGGGITSTCSGRFVLAAETVISLRYAAANAKATNGLGVKSENGRNSIFAEMKIWKVA